MDVQDLDMSLAACKETDTDVFFPEPGKGYTQAIELAKGICASCAIKVDCSAVAIENNYEGVWGGMTSLDRENYKRRMRRARRGRIHENSLANLRVDKTVQKINLAAANAKRAENSAAKSVDVVKHALAVLGSDVPDNLMRVAMARLNNPSADLQQLADILGVTKDSYSGALRRLVKLASK